MLVTFVVYICIIVYFLLDDNTAIFLLIDFYTMYRKAVFLLLDINRLNNLFAETGIKKTAVAKRLNRNRVIFNDWEKGKSEPSDDQIEIVADALGTTAAYLRGETDIKEKHPLQTSDLTVSEQEMLKAFREADPALQRAALSVLRSATPK